LKNANFDLKFKGVNLYFNENASLWDENKPKIYILSMWGTYSLDIIDMYLMFVDVLKNIEFWLKTQRVSLWFYWKASIRSENKMKICISYLWGSYSVSVRCFGTVHNFLGVLKNTNFRLKI
jgi:hypothetical protein